MRSAALLALCGCNQIFGVSSTRLNDSPLPIDAQYFDAPIDAPFACPPPDQTPQFSPLLHQVISQPCYDYELGGGDQVAMAACFDFVNYSGYHAARGSADGTLTTISSFDDATASLQFVRLAAEGDEAWVTYYSTGAGQYQIRRYTLQAGGGWTRAPDYGVFAAYVAMSAPTRRPGRHLVQTGSDSNLHELAENADGTWSEVAVFTSNDLGLGGGAQVPTLSGDGLRLVFTSSTPGSLVTQVFYTARATIDARFRPAQVLDGVPAADRSHYYLNEDCSRIYFSGLQQIMYLRAR